MQRKQISLSDSEKIIFTPREVQQIYSVGQSTLEQWRLKGLGPKFIRLEGSRLVRYRKQDILEHLASHTAVQSTTEADQVCGATHV